MAMRYRANSVGATLPAIVSETTCLMADRTYRFRVVVCQSGVSYHGNNVRERERERESYASGGNDHLDVVARHISEYFVMGRCSWQVPPSNQYRVMSVAAPPSEEACALAEGVLAKAG